MDRKIDLGETRGIKRRLDKLGRVVIPIEFRNTLEVNIKDEVEIYLLKYGFFIKKV